VKNGIVFFLLGLLFLLAFPASGQDPIEIRDIRAIISTEMKGMEGQVFDPQICPSDPDLVAFQRQIKDTQELYIVDLLSGKLEKVTSRREEEKKEDYREESPGGYLQGVDWQLDWRPVLDSRQRQWYVFVGDGGVDNFDLYLGVAGEDTRIQLTDDGYNKFVDAQPKWSPDGKHIVFISQRTGNGDMYLIKHVDRIIEENAEPKPPEQLTTNPELDFYPVWNPEPTSGYIAYSAINKDPLTERRYLSTNLLDLYFRLNIEVTAPSQEFDYTRPSWDPFTGSFLSYYVSERLMETARIDMKKGGITREQSAKIGVSKIELDENMNVKPKEVRGENPYIAFNVLPDDYSGPTWLSGSQFIMFVRSKLEQFNPIYVANQEYWSKNLGGFTYKVDQRFKLPVDLSIRGDKVVYSCQEGKEYKIVMGTLAGTDFQVFEHPMYALARPDLHEQFMQDKVVELPGGEPPGIIKWLSRPLVGDNPLLFLNRRYTPIAAGMGVVLYLILKPEEPIPDGIDHWNPPDWPQSKKIGFRIKF